MASAPRQPKPLIDMREARSGSASRRWLLGISGLLSGFVASLLFPANLGCIYHDTCIQVKTAGTNWCVSVAGAVMWDESAGESFLDGVIVKDSSRVPLGCECYNDAEDEVLSEEQPSCLYEEFAVDLEQRLRADCAAIVAEVNPGWSHNCFTTEGEQAPTIGIPVPESKGECVGACEYGPEPGGDGSCPTPTPYECDGETEAPPADCEAIDGETEGADSTTGGGGDDESGESSGGEELEAGQYISCDGLQCDIEREFAQRLYDSPLLLQHERARLVYSPKLRRHVLDGVEPGSVAHTLGLRDGDVLEAIDGRVIDGLEAALEAYVDGHQAASLQVLVKRDSQWVEFTYEFVP